MKNSLKINTMLRLNRTTAKKKYKNDLDIVNEALKLAGHEKIRGLDTIAESYRNVI